MPREMLWKKIEREQGRTLGCKSAIFEKSNLGDFRRFLVEMNFGAWRIRIRDQFYMQIALRTPLIDAEISKIAKIVIFMDWGT